MRNLYFLLFILLTCSGCAPLYLTGMAASLMGVSRQMEEKGQSNSVVVFQDNRKVEQLNMLNSAKNYYREFDYEKTIWLLSQIIKHPYNDNLKFRAKLYRGSAFFQLGKVEDAKNDLTEATCYGFKPDPAFCNPNYIKLVRK